MISKSLLKDKLSDWVLSAKVQETLGLSNMDEATFKRQLAEFESAGVIERSGERRGLKFRFVDTESLVATPTSSKGSVEKPKSEKSEKISDKTDEDIPRHIINLPKHSYSDILENSNFAGLLKFILKDSENKLQISCTNTSQGITLKIHADGKLLFETVYTKENYLKFLKNSGITL